MYAPSACTRLVYVCQVYDTSGNRPMTATRLLSELLVTTGLCCVDQARRWGVKGAEKEREMEIDIVGIGESVLPSIHRVTTAAGRRVGGEDLKQRGGTAPPPRSLALFVGPNVLGQVVRARKRLRTYGA